MCFIFTACLPKRSGEGEQSLFMISEEENKKAKSREAVCREDGGIWKKENCYKSASKLASQGSCNSLPGWSWHAGTEKCLPTPTVKNMERCEAREQVYSKIGRAHV